MVGGGGGGTRPINIHVAAGRVLQIDDDEWDVCEMEILAKGPWYVFYRLVCAAVLYATITHTIDMNYYLLF